MLTRRQLTAVRGLRDTDPHRKFRKRRPSEVIPATVAVPGCEKRRRTSRAPIECWCAQQVCRLNVALPCPITTKNNHQPESMQVIFWHAQIRAAQQVK